MIRAAAAGDLAQTPRWNHPAHHDASRTLGGSVSCEFTPISGGEPDATRHAPASGVPSRLDFGALRHAPGKPLQSIDLTVEAGAGHYWRLTGFWPEQARAALLWLPALGVGARHYQGFAQALAERGVGVLVHEWRGNGSSSLRAGRRSNWGLRELLSLDIPASRRALDALADGIPLLVGGHSLGGQLACLHAGLDATTTESRARSALTGLWLVASGSPYWRGFEPPRRWFLPLVYSGFPWLASLFGAFPGRRLGFGGNEARGLIQDWARVGRTGIYRARGLPDILEPALAAVRLPVRAVLPASDWLAPAASLQRLLAKMPQASTTTTVLNADVLGVRADHFAWMKQPAAVIDQLVEGLPLTTTDGSRVPA